MKAEHNSKSTLECTDSELAESIRQGDRTAESEFCRRFGPIVLSHLRAETSASHHIEDIAQETLMIVLKHLRAGDVREPQKLASFARRTAHNVMIGSWRKTKRQRELLEQYADKEQVSEDNGFKEVLTEQRRKKIQLLLGSLNVDRDRQILAQTYLHETDRAHICKKLELSGAHFDRVISRARQRARKQAEELTLSSIV